MKAADHARVRARVADALAAMFHAHLDECERCRLAPFDLCDVGARALERAARAAAAA